MSYVILLEPCCCKETAIGAALSTRVTRFQRCGRFRRWQRRRNRPHNAEIAESIFSPVQWYVEFISWLPVILLCVSIHLKSVCVVHLYIVNLVLADMRK